jgi:Ca2+-binding EF-hand superfamily protein
MEIIGMKRFAIGGTIIAALFSAAVGTARSTSPTSAAPQAAHARGSFFTSNENRVDVPAHVERMFKALDLNHDGFVTKDEIASLQARFDQRMSTSAPKRAARMFDRLDTDHDGKVTQAELEAERAARLAAKRKSAKADRRAGTSSLFERADANKDGILTRAEFDAAIASGKIRLRHANMRGSAILRMFDAADANRDARVSLDEAQQAALRHFDTADVNHDGVLTPAERRQAGKTERTKSQAG